MKRSSAILKSLIVLGVLTFGLVAGVSAQGVSISRPGHHAPPIMPPIPPIPIPGPIPIPIPIPFPLPHPHPLPIIRCTPLPAGLVGWWKGEGNALDSAFGDNGTLINTTFTNGMVGQAFYLNGSNACVQIPDSAGLKPASVTVQAWVRLDALESPVAAYPGLQYIVFKQNTRTGNFEGFNLEKNRINGQDVFRFEIASADGQQVAAASTTVPQVGVWYYLVGTYDSSTGDLRLYVNGVLEGDVYAGFPLDYGTLPIFIGTTGQGWDGRVLGAVDEAAIYNRALASNEIAAVYATGGNICPLSCLTPPSGLIGWWPGEGNANDVVGGNNGTLEGGVTFASGMVGQGFRLDGTNSYVQIPDAAALKPANVTVEAWVWLDPNITTPRLEYIIFKRNSWTYLFEGYSLLKESRPNGDGTYTDRFSFVVTSGGDQVITYSTTAVQRGVWYHVAGTYDGNELTLWVNGAAEASAIAGFALDYGTRPVFIGTSGEPEPYNGKLAGIIDEASIYDRALSAAELQALYSAGSAGKCAGPLPPGITVQPSNQTTVQGSNVVLSVVAGGPGPFSYQWSFNGKNISGATNATLTLTNLHPNQSGSYAVTITTPYGSITSSSATVTVIAQNILVYKYSGTGKFTTAGQAFAYVYSGQMFFIPDSTNGTFVGWGTIKGKKQYWVNPLSDYLLITIPGVSNQTFTVLGQAGQEIDTNGYPSIWSYLHKGKNTPLTIGQKRYFSFPNTFTAAATRVYPDSLTGNLVLSESSSIYTFVPQSTQTANNTGQTMTDLVNALTKSLDSQGYQKQ